MDCSECPVLIECGKARTRAAESYAKEMRGRIYSNMSGFCPLVNMLDVTFEQRTSNIVRVLDEYDVMFGGEKNEGKNE